MRKTFCAEVDLTGAVVGLVKRGHYSGVSVTIFGTTYLGNSKPCDYYLPKQELDN